MSSRIIFFILIMIFMFSYSTYAQTINFDKTAYIGIKNTTAIITVNDPGANTNPSLKDDINITITSSSDSTGINLTLTETGENTADFIGYLYFDLNSSVQQNSKIMVKDGDLITAQYDSVSDTATWEEFKITSIKTADANNNGYIDTLLINFNEPANIIYDSGNSGLYCLSIADGTYNYAVNNEDYSLDNPQNPLKVHLIERNQTDTGVTPTVTYDDSGNSHIIGSNCGDELQNNSYSSIDRAVPVVVDVYSSTTDGIYNAGNTINIKISFSENVVVSETPSLSLNSGGIANYISGSGSNILDLNYMVNNGENSNHLDYTSVNSLSGNIKDVAGNSSNLLLPLPGSTGSLGANSNIIIDTNPPTVINVIGTDGYYNAVKDVDIVVYYSENVFVTGSPYLILQLDGAVTENAFYLSGSGTNQLVFRYPVQSGDNSSDLDYVNSNSLSLNGGTIRDAASNNAINTLPNPGSSGSLSANNNIVVDTIQPTMLSATFHDPDNNDIDKDDYISVEFDEPVRLNNCNDSSDFILLNAAYGDTFGNGSYLKDTTPDDNYIEIFLGDSPHLILPGIWSSPGEKMPSGIGIKSGGTTCVVDLADNSASDLPEVDVGGSGSNSVAMVIASDGADVFSNPNSQSTFMDTDINVSITLDYKGLYVALWYDVGRNPDGINTQNSDDRKVLASGSGKNWNAIIPSDDPDIKEGSQVRFILNIDGVLYYSDGSESTGGGIPWSFTIVYEQKDRVTIRNNMINPKNGDLVYLNYYLNGSKKVYISLFDMAGDRVKVLKNRIESAGAHLVTWNGKNQKGQNCIPGLYYVLIKIGKKRYVKKVLILK